MDTQEGIIGMGLASTLHTVLIQSSPKIFSVWSEFQIQKPVSSLRKFPLQFYV